MPEPAEHTAKTAPGNKRRNWLRFSLKSLMLLLTLVCVVLGGKLQYDWYKKKWLVQKWIAPIVEDARQSKAGMSRYFGGTFLHGGGEFVGLPPSPDEVTAENEVELLK